MKPKLCQYPGCEDEAAYFPHSSIKRKFCQNHAIATVIEIQRKQNQKMKEELEKERQKKKLTPHQKFYKTTAWKWCSRYVKLYYSDEDLMVACSTSGRMYRVNDPQLICGHYLKADRHHATAFEFKNLAPQSDEQNNNNGGNEGEMARWIDRTHGPGTVEWLHQKKNQVLKFDQLYLEEVANYYKQLFEAELNRRGIKNPWEKP